MMTMGHNQGYPKSSDTHFYIFHATKGRAFSTHTKKGVSEIFKHWFDHSLFKLAIF